MNEIDAKEIIVNIVQGTTENEQINIVARKPINRLEHQAIFAIVFNHDENIEIDVIKKVKNLATSNPLFSFGGSEPSDKFNMEFVAVFVIVTIK